MGMGSLPTAEAVEAFMNGATMDEKLKDCECILRKQLKPDSSDFAVRMAEDAIDAMLFDVEMTTNDEALYAQLLAVKHGFYAILRRLAGERQMTEMYESTSKRHYDAWKEEQGMSARLRFDIVTLRGKLRKRRSKKQD